MNILERRLENRMTVGEHLAKLWQSKYDRHLEPALQEVVWDVW